MKRVLIYLFVCFSSIAYSQTATFITLSSGGRFDKVTVGATGCTSTPLNLCSNFSGSPLSIALDSNILYVVDNGGFLYKNTLSNTGTTGNCIGLGRFNTPTASSINYYGLTVGPNGIVYTAIDGIIESYNPTTGIFAVLGTLPNGWVIGGDLLFYQGNLFEAVKTTTGANALVQIDLANVSASTLYMNFNAGTSVFGFASVTIPCSNNQAYALSTVGSSTDIYAVDMTNKTQSPAAACTVGFKVNDAASLAETQSATPPPKPAITNPYNFCQNQTNPVLGIAPGTNDTLRWYTQATGGTSYGKPTPDITTNAPSTSSYYVSNYDTATGCEGERVLVTVNIIATAPNPSISIFSAKTFICPGGNNSFTATITNGGTTPAYQWYKNGAIIGGASANVYSASGLSNNDTIRCTVTSSSACVNNPTAISNNEIVKTINPVAAPLSLSSCNQVTYLGNVYTSNSTVKDTVKSTDGCDSIYNTVTITIAPLIATYQTLNLSHCSSVTYNSIAYTANTVLKDTARSKIGCGDSVYFTVNISINPIIVKINTIGISSCKAVKYAGNTYSSSTVVKDTVKSYQGCDSIYNIATITITSVVTTDIIVNLRNCDSIVFKGITYFATSIHIDTVKSHQGCDSVYHITNIIVEPKPTVNVAKDVYVLPNSSATLSPQYTDDATYDWSPSTYLDNTTAKYPLCKPLNDITYTIKVYNAAGCADTAYLNVIIAREPVIPNVFSPNGDGINDDWDIGYINAYPKSTVQVFSRGGQKVFSSFAGSYKPWTGKVNGKDVPVGVYYYIITLDSSKPVITGAITILR